MNELAVNATLPAPPLQLKEPAPAGSHRIAQLDGLRALAILSVFVHHALKVPLLWMGVDLFFVLSGFLITGILLQRKQSGKSYFGYFYTRRARRILAPYVVLLAVSSCLFGVEWMKYWYWYAFFATNIGGALQQVGHESLVPLWSLAVEEQFYFVWPVVILLVSERALVWVAAALVLIAPLLRAVATPFFSSPFPIYFMTPFRMDLLCAGALLAVVWRKRPALFQRFSAASYGVAVAAMLVLVWLSHYPRFRTGSNSVLTNTLLYSVVAVLMTAVVAAALSGKGLFCRILKWPALGYIGIISYSMYLIHMSTIVLARQFFTNRLAVFCVALSATVLYATATWYGFEKRLLKR